MSETEARDSVVFVVVLYIYIISVGLFRGSSSRL